MWVCTTVTLNYICLKLILCNWFHCNSLLYQSIKLHSSVFRCPSIESECIFIQSNMISIGNNTKKSHYVIQVHTHKKYLSNTFNKAKFFAIGEDIFIKEIEASGLIYSKSPAEIDILIVTLDRTLTYEKLEITARALENGARLFAANIDDTCPVDEGEVLDAGSTISALEKRTQKKLEQHFGKPSLFMFEEVRRRLKVDLKKVLLIGDRLETDIALGNNFGIDSALVSTGVKFYPNGADGIKPTYYLNSVADLLNSQK